MFSAHVRKLVQLWLAASVIVFAAKLVPVLARFRIEGQELIDRELERRQPPPPTVEPAADSPSPNLTIRMQGRAIAGLDDGSIPAPSLSFTSNVQQLAVTYDQVLLVDVPEAKLTRTLPTDNREENLWNGAISGDESVIATVGEFTLIKFWDARTGRLIEAHEDRDPTIAARPDSNPHSRKHTNKLRYSEMGARRVVAAPGGCVFAIGKVDGSIELWGPAGETLPTEPAKLSEIKRFEPKPRRFERLARSQPHTGEVVGLVFSRDCQSLLSISGAKVEKYEASQVTDGAPPAPVRVASKDSKPQLVRSRVPSNEVIWSVPLADLPSALALDDMSQELEGKGLLNPARLAVVDYSRKVSIHKLETGEVLQTIDARQEGGHGMLTSVAFATGGSYLWTVGMRYESGSSGEHKTVTLVSAWDLTLSRRIATAHLPGQVHVAEWDRHGKRLALLRYNPAPGGLTTQARQWHLPWELPPPSPFMLHLWNVNIDQK